MRLSGVGVFRQRQAERSIQGKKSHGSDTSKPKSGLVVTRYGPPPTQFPPPANAWGPGGPYPPPAAVPPPSPYGGQPPLPYPPPIQQPPYAAPYPPTNGSYGPPAAPPTAPGPAYGQYGQAPYLPPRPPSSYGPPAPYSSGNPYTPGPYPLPYQPPPRTYPVPPPPGYTNPPLPGPPPPPPSYPPGYGAGVPPGPPPPPGIYPPPVHATGYSPPAPYTNPCPPPHSSGWQQDSGGQGSQRHSTRRDRRKRGRGQAREASVQRLSSASRQSTPKSSVLSKDDKEETSKPDTGSVKKEAADSKEDDLDADFLWDLEKAFIELEPKVADPVGKPLAAEWNDDPTIPPAYNAKCIKTAFYDPDNPDAFLASVRDTKYWTEINRDPAFRFRRGMVTVQFAGSHHEYFTYHCSRKTRAEWSKDREIVPGPSDPTLNDALKPRSATHGPLAPKRDESPSRLTTGKRSYHEAGDYSRDAKRPRHATGRDPSPSSMLPPRPRPRDVDFEMDSWAPRLGEGRLDSPHRPYSRDGYSRSPGYRLQGGECPPPYKSTQRHDSGYHSAHSAEKSRHHRDDRSHSHRSPLSSIGARERDISRERDLERDRDRDFDRQREREWDRPRSPHHPRPRSSSRSRTLLIRTPTPPARSRTARGADTDDESVMSDLEYELLGLERPTSKKAGSQKPTFKKQRPKVDNAFRWATAMSHSMYGRYCLLIPLAVAAGD